MSVRAFFHSPLDRTQTNRWLPGKFDDYRPLSLYREQRGLKIIKITIKNDVTFTRKEINGSNESGISVCINVTHCILGEVEKGKERILVDSATYIVQTINSRAVQSQKGQLIGKSQWCRSAQRSTRAATTCTKGPNQRSRSSPREHSPEVATIIDPKGIKG